MAYRYLVIMAQQRSGTHLLGACIASHPRIRYTGEIFCRNVPQVTRHLTDGVARVSCGDVDVVCLDIKYNQISAPVMDWMARPEVKVIHLVRHDRLAMYFSGELHTHRGYYPGTVDIPTFRFEPLQFYEIEDYVNKHMHRCGWLTDLKLYYEDLTGGRSVHVLPEWASEMICLLAGVPYCQLSTDFGKDAPVNFMQYLTGVPERLLQKYGH